MVNVLSVAHAIAALPTDPLTVNREQLIVIKKRGAGDRLIFLSDR